MTTEELWFSLVATALGSGLAVKLFEALVDWRKGRVSKIAALEAALEEAEAALEQIRQAKHALADEHRVEVSTLLKRQRELELEVHRLKVELISLGHDPNTEVDA